jgi:actin-related protein
MLTCGSQLAIGSTKAGSRDNAVRKIALTLPPGFPLPLLSTVLDTLFIHFEPPSISLLSAPMLSTMAAGVRDAIVVDIGWCETTVTAVYECREISTKRSTRAMKLLVKHMAALLKNETKSEHSNVKISFEECEDITSRLCWCKSSSASGGDLYTASQCAGLEDNGQLVSGTPASTGPRQKLKFPLKRATEPCETALFAENVKESELDDEELPVHLLLYNSLLHLPVDVRSVCMSRVIITGGGSNIPGLKTRIINEVRSLVCQRGWDVVRRGGHCSAIAGSKVARRPHSSTVPEPQGALDDPTAQQAGIGADAEQGLAGIAAPHSRQPRNIDADLHKHREKNRADDSLGSLQGIDSMGSWAGASLLCQMRIAAVSVVHKDQWLQHGLAGASKSKEVVPLTKQRQSMGPTGLRVAAAASEQASWTLGQWA